MTDFHHFYICIHIGEIKVGLLHVHFCTAVSELWPLIYARISFPLQILRTNQQIFTKFYISIHIEKDIGLGYYTFFSHMFTRVMALDLC